MNKQGPVSAGSTKIRVFWPNPTGYNLGPNPNPEGLNAISKQYNISYLEVLDPIYHELVFIDDKGTRHRIIGLAYHMEETMELACGIDGQA